VFDFVDNEQLDAAFLDIEFEQLQIALPLNRN